MRKLILLVLVLAVSGAASASIITSVDRSGGYTDTREPIGFYNGETEPLATEAGGLADGKGVFSDRMFSWINTPASLLGSEYIRTFNSDKLAQATVTYKVTTSEAATIFFTIDDRFETEYGWVMQDLADAVAGFAAAGTFTDSGMDLVIRERANGSRDRRMSVFSADLDAGTYIFNGVPPGKNFTTYGAVPEPTTMALLGMGGMALLRRRPK